MSQDCQNRLLTSPVSPPKEILNIAVPLHSRSSRVCGVVEELQFDFGIELGLEEGEKSGVILQCLDQRFSRPFALQIHPNSKRSEWG